MFFPEHLPDDLRRSRRCGVRRTLRGARRLLLNGYFGAEAGVHADHDGVRVPGDRRGGRRYPFRGAPAPEEPRDRRRRGGAVAAGGGDPVRGRSVTAGEPPKSRVPIRFRAGAVVLGAGVKVPFPRLPVALAFDYRRVRYPSGEDGPRSCRREAVSGPTVSALTLGGDPPARGAALTAGGPPPPSGNPATIRFPWSHGSERPGRVSRCSSVVEQLIRNQQVGGSNPLAGSPPAPSAACRAGAACRQRSEPGIRGPTGTPTALRSSVCPSRCRMSSTCTFSFPRGGQHHLLAALDRDHDEVPAAADGGFGKSHSGEPRLRAHDDLPGVEASAGHFADAVETGGWFRGCRGFGARLFRRRYGGETTSSARAPARSKLARERSSSVRAITRMPGRSAVAVMAIERLAPSWGRRRRHRPPPAGCPARSRFSSREGVALEGEDSGFRCFLHLGRRHLDHAERHLPIGEAPDHGKGDPTVAADDDVVFHPAKFSFRDAASGPR